MSYFSLKGMGASEIILAIVATCHVECVLDERDPRGIAVITDKGYRHHEVILYGQLCK